MRKNVRKMPVIGRIIAVVLCLIMTVPLTALISCGNNKEPVYDKGVSFVAIDINPSVELLLDSKDRVVSVYAANEDAEIMLYNADGILGESVEDAAVRLAELSEEYGYITEDNAKISAVAVADSDSKADKLIDKVKRGFESGCETVKATVQAGKDAVLGALLQRVKEEYPDNEKIQSLDVARYRLIRSAMAADRDLTVTEAAEMSVEELTAIVDAKRAERRYILNRVMEMAVENAEMVCQQTKSNLLNTVYIKYGGLEAVKYIALDNAYFTVALISKMKSDLAEFGITEAAARQVALDLGLPVEKVDEFVADCKTSEGYITDETISYAVNKWYRNADAALQAKMDEKMPEFAAKLDTFSEQVNRIASPVVTAIKSALDTLKTATGIELSFAIKTYADVEELAEALRVKADESKQKMMASLTETEIVSMEADIAKLDAKMQAADETLRKSIEKAKTEAENLLKAAQEKRAEKNA